MQSKEPVVYLRIAAELLERSYRVRNYLKNVPSGETGEYSPVVSTIRHALDRNEEELTNALSIASISTDPNSGLPDPDYMEVLFDNLRLFSKWFTTVHDLLVHLPQPPTMAETVYMLRGTYPNLYDHYSPSIIFSNVFNALEFDFYELLEDRLGDLSDIVIDDTQRLILELPTCDLASPPAWAVLGHELAHAIDQENRVSKYVTDDFIRDTDTEIYELVVQWCSELSADLIAARVLGPTPILAHLSLVYCVLPQQMVDLPTESHPSTRWRLDFIGKFLSKQNMGTHLLESEMELLRAAHTCNLPRAYDDETKSGEISRAEDAMLNDLILPMYEPLENSVMNIEGIQNCGFDSAALDRCLRRLRQGLPIGAQGESREDLRDAISTYRDHRNENPDDFDRAEFGILVSRFQEKPLDIPIIMLSNHIRRQEIQNEALSVPGALATKDQVEEMCSKLHRLDELVASSIRASSVHGELVNKP